jgi:hypothetical protein
MLRLAGRLADGVVLSAGISAGYARHSLGFVAKGAQAAGRDLSSLHNASYVFVMKPPTMNGVPSKQFGRSLPSPCVIGFFMRTLRSPEFRSIRTQSLTRLGGGTSRAQRGSRCFFTGRASALYSTYSEPSIHEI